jgi:uncharacterized protein (TIGR03437 family)
MRFAARGLFALLMIAVPATAQVAQVPISMSPGDGIPFFVDGQQFQGSSTFLWPQGSKHTVSVQPVEYGNTPKVQYVFKGWVVNTLVIGTGLVSAPVADTTFIITADPYVKSVVANFSIGYEFDVIYYSCATDGSPCLSPGMIYGVPCALSPPGFIIQTTSCYVAPGTIVTLRVQPNLGYIFTGWIESSGTGNINQSFVNSWTVNAPLSVYPQFHLSRPVSVGIVTSPPGLQVLTDHTAISAPANLEWGSGTVHSLSVASPQIDSTSGNWVFSSWSDGGAQNHNYTVPDGYSALSLTALFLPAHRVTFETSPPGLNLSVNGRTNWPSLTFVGAAGTPYQLSAPASQLDAQGRINQFVSWSNGGQQSQTYIQPANDDRLTVNYQTLGHLTLISSPPGLTFTVNGKACVSPCAFDQLPGTQMNISVPNSIPLTGTSRLDFQGWQDAPAATRVYTMTSAVQTLSASYQTMFMVAAASTPATAGSVILQPTSQDGFYPANTLLQATVSQNPGFAFRSWQGDVVGSQALATFNVGGPKTFGAVFGPVPYLPPAAVQNAAGSTPVNGVSPGAVVSIYGLNLSSDTQVGPSNPLAQTLLNVTATLGSQILPVYFVSPQQINVQLPFEASLGDQVVVVHQQGQPDVNAVFSVVRNAPGLFSINHPDGSAVTASSPATADEILTVTGTGFGPYDRTPPDGLLIPTGSTFTLLDSVTISAGDTTALALSAGPSYTSVGLNTATFQLPASFPSGSSVQLKVTINGADSNQLPLFVQ